MPSFRATKIGKRSVREQKRGRRSFEDSANGLTTLTRLHRAVQSGGHAQSLCYFAEYKGHAQWSGHWSDGQSRRYPWEGPVITGVERGDTSKLARKQGLRVGGGQRLSSRASVTACHRQVFASFVEHNPRV